MSDPIRALAFANARIKELEAQVKRSNEMLLSWDARVRGLNDQTNGLAEDLRTACATIQSQAEMLKECEWLLNNHATHPTGWYDRLDDAIKTLHKSTQKDT